MIVPFPRCREPNPFASALYAIAEAWASVWLWWLPRQSHTVVYLDDYRQAQSQRKRANA